MRGERRSADSSGYTIVEMVVALSILGMLSVGVFEFVFLSVKTWDRTRDDLRTTSRARAALVRMTRDLREASTVTQAEYPAGEHWLEADIDYDGSGTITNTANDSAETIRYVFDPASGEVSIQTTETPAPEAALLADGIDDVVFGYASHDLTYDWDGDGRTSWQELDAAPSYGIVGVGNNNGILDTELSFVDNVTITVTVDASGTEHDYVATVELRNRHET